MRTAMPFSVLATALAATLSAAPALAQVTRTYVSAAGSDSNNCSSVATPCRHFQAAVNATAAAGEVVALDPANYGSFTISHAITINGQGWSYVAPPVNGTAITITANPNDNISIRGVLLNGIGTTGGTNGIVFNVGAGLTIADCVVQNFVFSGLYTTGNGILVQPTSGALSLVITNTVVSHNDHAGIFYAPPSGASATAQVVIDHVVAANNQLGIGVTTFLGGGSTIVAISNVIASNNSGNGITISNAESATFAASIDNISASGNVIGLAAFGTPTVTLGRSVITNNSSYGVYAEFPSQFFSYQDNRVNGNTPDFNVPVFSHPLK